MYWELKGTLFYSYLYILNTKDVTWSSNRVSYSAMNYKAKMWAYLEMVETESLEFDEPIPKYSSLDYFTTTCNSFYHIN